MADTVNRIAPLAGTIDRAGPSGKERKQNGERDGQRKSSRLNDAPPQSKTDPPEQAEEPEKDKTKGRNIDITA